MTLPLLLITPYPTIIRDFVGRNASLLGPEGKAAAEARPGPLASFYPRDFHLVFTNKFIYIFRFFESTCSSEWRESILVPFSPPLNGTTPRYHLERFGLSISARVKDQEWRWNKKFRWTVRVNHFVPSIWKCPCWSACDEDVFIYLLAVNLFEWIMDYSYLNQAAAAAAAGFEASSCALAASEMQCGYGDLSSCSQMSQAAYRYTAARAAGYPGNAGTTSTGSTTPLGAHHTTHSHAHAHHGAHTTPCSVMAARSQEVHRHAASIFPSAINLQSECKLDSIARSEGSDGRWWNILWNLIFHFVFILDTRFRYQLPVVRDFCNFL